MKIALCNKCQSSFEDATGKAKYCSECKKKPWLIWNNRTWENSPKGKTYMKKYFQEYSAKLKKQIFDYYGWACKCCSETLLSMLTVDHVNNDGYKDRQKKISGTTFYKKIIAAGFPDDYQILCMNCNWSKKIMNGTCQHQI